MKKEGIVFIAVLLGLVLETHSREREFVKSEFTPEMEWFKDAKFGIFIHWGIYGVNGIGESWPIFNKRLSLAEYMKQCDQFTASKYEPGEWAQLFKEAGAQYAVITAKHCDGVTLWDTKANDLSVVKKTPAQRDLLTPFVDAVRQEGLKVGLYFSWADWASQDYGTLGKLVKTDVKKTEPDSLEAWQRFRASNDTQLKELCSYDPDLLWFDADWDVPDEYWDMKGMRSKLKAWAPNVVLNSRMGEYGDYDTPEQGIPFAQLPRPWELCMTMSLGGWGYAAHIDDQPENQIDAPSLIHLLSETVAMGGNLLLNIGPKPDGTITQWQADNLKTIGTWLKLNGEAVYGSRAGIHKNHYAGCSTLSKDRKTLYLFVSSTPVNGLMLKGLQNDPKNISIIGAPGAEVKMKNAGGAPWNKVPPTRFMKWPDDVEVGLGRVVKIELEDPIDLYTGKSGMISQND